MKSGKSQDKTGGLAKKADNKKCEGAERVSLKWQNLTPRFTNYLMQTTDHTVLYNRPVIYGGKLI